MFWAGDKEVTKIWLAGLINRDVLSLEERWRFDSVLRSYLQICETMFVQAALGAGDNGIVVAEENGIRQIFASQGVREWWKENPAAIPRFFRAYIDALMIAPR